MNKVLPLASGLAMALLVCGIAWQTALGADRVDSSASRIHFTDVSVEAGVAKPLKGAYLHAIAWGDADGDGLVDAFIGNFSDRSPLYGATAPPPNFLLRQVRKGEFERQSMPVIEVAGRCSGAAFVDLDNDGDLDLFVTSNTLPVPTKEGVKRPPQLQRSTLYRNDGGGRFVDVSEQSGACPATMFRCRDVGVFDYDGDGLLDLCIMQDIGADPVDRPRGVHLFRNLGDFKFRNVASEVGLTEELWSTGIAVADLNADRRPDFYLCGVNRLFLSQTDATFREAEALRALFNPPEKELDWVTGASFGDVDCDGDLDLITGRHHYYGPSRIHVYLNDGLQAGVPQYREATTELGIQPLPQKAPHPEIQDFDNDGHPDLYWSAFFAEKGDRQPFVCRGLGVRDGMPRFDVPPTSDLNVTLVNGKVSNETPDDSKRLLYYVCTPAVDYDSDGDLDLLVGNWPEEGSRLLRNDTRGGNWLSVRVVGRVSNRMGVGAKVSLYRAGLAGKPEALLGVQDVTVNGGYSSSRPAVVHFGLGETKTCDVVVQLPRPAHPDPIITKNVAANQKLLVRE